MNLTILEGIFNFWKKCVVFAFLLVICVSYGSSAFAYYNKHGYIPTNERLLSKLELNKSTLEDVEFFLGPPVFKNLVQSDSYETWYYVETKIKEYPFVGNVPAGGESLKLTFDKKQGVLKKIEKFKVNDRLIGMKDRNSIARPSLTMNRTHLSPESVLELRKINIHHDTKAVEEWMTKIRKIKEEQERKIKEEQERKIKEMRMREERKNQPREQKPVKK